MGRRCGDCDCSSARGGLRGLSLGGWIWGIRLQAPRGPALRVRDSVAAAATWLDIARYSDTGGISQRYTPGGGYYDRAQDTFKTPAGMNPPAEATTNFERALSTASQSMGTVASISSFARSKSGGDGRGCQVVARKELSHRNANCRAADGAQPSPFSADPGPPVDSAKLLQDYQDIIDEAGKARMTHTRIHNLAAAEKLKPVAAVADLVGGAEGAFCLADADQLLTTCELRSSETAAAARAACASLRAARASGNRSMLVWALAMCGDVARQFPDEMVNAEIKSREQESISCSPASYGHLDLSHEGRISLPTTPAALSRLGTAYYEAALAAATPRSQPPAASPKTSDAPRLQYRK